MSQGTILIVEDDLEIRKTLTWILEAEGYAVVTAENGAAGLAALDTIEPDLVMLDGYMPVMDGVEFAREFNRRGFTHPILAMTASRGPDWPAEIGAAARVGKPFDLEQLLALIARLVSSGAAPASSNIEPR